MAPPATEAAPALIGESSEMHKIRRLITRLGTSRAQVLLLGESGTGKEVVARAIYNANPRGNFVPIDCGSLVGPLMESELFGHTRGAFTGAADTKKGLIEQADGGTAFFDEIGDLPLEMQVKLLRLLQEHEFRAVGSLRRQKVDIRVIAATHRDLKVEVERGRFREDLYFRLNVAVVHLAPLRERREDIPPLIDQFLAEHGNRHRLSPEALDVMLAYDWPGNVRELRNAIERMVTLNSGPELRVADLPSSLQHVRWEPEPVFEPGEPPESLPAFRARFPLLSLVDRERQSIVEALRATGGDRARAAAGLGISRTTLYRKIKTYKIKVDDCARRDV